MGRRAKNDPVPSIQERKGMKLSEVKKTIPRPIQLRATTKSGKIKRRTVSARKGSPDDVYEPHTGRPIVVQDTFQNLAQIAKFQPSPYLITLMENLTPLQFRAIPKLVEHYLLGKPVEWLFNKHNPERLTNRMNYQRNWRHDPIFKEALRLAKAEAEASKLGSVVNDTLKALQNIAPKATVDLHRQIQGDEHAIEALSEVAGNLKRPIPERLAAIKSMSQIGTGLATDLLLELINDQNGAIRKAVVEAIGISAAGRDPSRRLADQVVLNHAAKETAAKGGGSAADPEAIREELDQVVEERWEKVIPRLKKLQRSQDD